MEIKRTTPEPPGSPGGKSSEKVTWYKNEVKHLKGKIQGYQTLSSLLQESKQEIRELKNKNTELLRRIAEYRDSLNQVGPSSITDNRTGLDSVTEEKGLALDAARGSGHPSVASENCELGDMEIVNQDAVLTEMTEDARMTSDVPASLEIDPYDLHAAMEGTTEQGIDTNPAEHPHHLSTSASNGDISGSIVMIPSDDNVNPFVPLLPDATVNALGPHSPLVTQVAHISEALTRNIGLDAPSDLSNAMARLAIDVLKVEKELKTKQTVINNLCPENEGLKVKLESTIRAREKSIQHLQEENRELQQKLSELSKHSMSSGSPVKSPDWVHVQDPKRTQQLKERFEEQTRQLESLHEAEVQQLQVHVEDLRAKLREVESAAAKRQEDSQRLLNMAKQRSEEEAKSKDMAIEHFHVEQERRHQCEAELIAERRRAISLSEHVNALETQLTLFQDAQFSNNLSPEESLSSLTLLSPQELRTKVQLLQQQMAIYKEDFDRERHDREQIQADKDAIESVLARYKTDLVTTQRKARELEQERELLKSENTCLRQEFQQKIDEIRRMTSMPSAPPASSFIRDRPNATWKCSACTFDNPAVRSSCEVCGRSRGRSHTHGMLGARLISHNPPTPSSGWTECDAKTPTRVTRGDDLIIDEGEDVPDKY